MPCFCYFFLIFSYFCLFFCVFLCFLSLESFDEALHKYGTFGLGVCVICCFEDGEVVAFLVVDNF